jgi:hypothetical protein
MGGKKQHLRSDFKIVYVRLPPDKVEQWRAAMALLLEWILEEHNDKNQKENSIKIPSSPREDEGL